jgi:Tfp pilus assembly protein PilF
LKRAVEYATRAKDLEPNNIRARLSLGTAYLVAGMPKNARREVEYALNLDSDNALAQTLMKQVKRADR